MRGGMYGLTLWELAVGLAHTHGLDREDTHRTCRVYLAQIEGADAATYREDVFPDRVGRAIEDAFSVGMEWDQVLDAPHCEDTEAIA